MRAIRYVLLTIGCAVTVYADPNAEEQTFLTVPGAAWRYDNGVPRVFQQTDLPAQLRTELEGYDWGTDETPKQFHGFTLDLNKDGKKEYFIETIYGGSGGPAYLIFTSTGKGWRLIGDYQGVIHVMRAGRGWPAFIVTGRGGGGNFSKAVHKFR